MQKEKEEKDSKVYALFVDLKAAFDNVRREDLWRILKEKEINNSLPGRVKKLYEETLSSLP